MNSSDAIQAIQMQISKVAGELDRAMKKVADLQSQLESLNVAERVMKELTDWQEPALAFKGEYLPIKDRILALFDSYEKMMTPKDVVAALGESVKYASVASDMHRMKKSGTLVQTDGKYHLPAQKGETPRGGGVSNAA